MRGLALLVIAAVIAACSSSSSRTKSDATISPAAGSAAASASTSPSAPPPAAAGWPATLSLTDDNGCFTRGGQVLCWGDNEYGVLGDASVRSRDEAAPIAGIADAIDVVVLGSTACALRRGGEVVCWGRNEPMHAVLGDGTDLAASLGHACALRRGGKVACWGFSTERAHGNAHESVDAPTDVEGVTDATAIAVSYKQSCAVRRGGQLLCWGSGIDASDKADWMPFPMPGAADIDAVWGGLGTVCLRRKAGEVACLGTPPDDDPYDGVRTTAQAFVPVEEWAGARHVATGPTGVCAVLSDARTSCRGDLIARSAWWLASLSEEYGTGVDDADGAIAIAAASRLCILDAAGLPRCRGGATFYTPRPVAGVDDAVAFGGGDNGACVRRRSAPGLWCWGSFNTLGSKASRPETLEGDVPEAVQIHVDRELCVVDRKARLVCGGGFDHTGRPQLERVRQYATMGFHACVVRTDATVWCWGYNSKGELGDGTTTSVPEDKPVQARGVKNAVEVVAGYQMSCARLRSGAVRCWGTGATDKFIEGDVPGVTDAVELDAATNFACARRKSGAVTCWGSIYDLVRGDYMARGPIDLPGITDAVDVDAGDHDLCIARANGSVVCFGSVTGRIDADPPGLRIPGFEDAIAVSTGDRTVCALRRGGGVSCMGNNHYGAVGDGSAEELRPITVRVE